MSIRTLVVDDEPLARYDLKEMLSIFEDIIVVEEAESASEAEQMIHETKFDLIFLDIELETEQAGFLLAERLSKQPDAPYVVFVTTHDEFAVAGYKYFPVHYLIKPIEEEQMCLAEAINQARKLLNQFDRKIQIIYCETNQYGETRKIESYIEIQKIVMIQKVKCTNKADVYLYGGQILERATGMLKSFKSELEDADFFSPHHSFLMNLQHVRYLRARISANHRNKEVVLNGIEKTVPISSTPGKLKALQDALEKMGKKY